MQSWNLSERNLKKSLLFLNLKGPSPELTASCPQPKARSPKPKAQSLKFPCSPNTLSPCILPKQGPLPSLPLYTSSSWRDRRRDRALTWEDVLSHTPQPEALISNPQHLTSSWAHILQPILETLSPQQGSYNLPRILLWPQPPAPWLSTIKEDISTAFSYLENTPFSRRSF